MLFFSHEFLFGFLPIVLGVFLVLRHRAPWEVAISWLVVASLLFYGWWRPIYLVLLLGSVVGNFVCGRALARPPPGLPRRWLLAAGVAGNLGLLGYFKYAYFVVDTVNTLAGADLALSPIVLPLAISFFTFQQIAYLIDVYRGQAGDYRFLHYCLFVVFFPQLIAGPIVYHAEVMPQFDRAEGRRYDPTDFAVGFSLFALGLVKKLVFADSLGAYADPVFAAAELGERVTFLEAWSGAVAFGLQIYFDFSGYSDMALGLARMFGIRLPFNFDSPYKAASVIEFWRRWHMTLSRFLREYLYVPLGGSRKGEARRNVNIVVVMLLGGLWHGAGWTFVLWGGLHGFYLMLNHAWRRLRPGLPVGRWAAALGVLATTCVVMFAWIPFRADGLQTTLQLWSAMLGLDGLVLPESYRMRLGGLSETLAGLGVEFGPLPTFGGRLEVLLLGLLMAACWFLPNSQEWLGRFMPRAAMPPARWPRRLAWRPSPAWAVAVGGMVFVAVLVTFRAVESPFIYFQF